MYFDQLLCAARKVHAVCFNQLSGATHYTHFISNHDKTKSDGKLYHLRRDAGGGVVDRHTTS